MGAEAPGWNRDTTIGVVGSLVLIAAMAGVFLYERGQFDDYTITWGTAEGVLASDDGTLSQGASQSFEAVVAHEGVARVRAVVTWTDDAGDPDTFEVVVRDPGGAEVDRQSGSSGEVMAEATVTEAPARTSVAARSPEDARDQAMAGLDASAGQGTWTVEVLLVEAPGTTLPGANVEAAADGSNDFDVEVVLVTWDARLAMS